MIPETPVTCPYCGEPFTALVDSTGGDQHYIEDCPVCCRPIEFRIATDGDGELLDVALFRDDE